MRGEIMKVGGVPYRTIWPHPEQEGVVQIIDQRQLPHRFVVEDIRSAEEMALAIRDMHVRGAPLIGAAAAWGLYLAAHAATADGWTDRLRRAGDGLKGTRPTAVNLAWAVDRMLAARLHNDCATRRDASATRMSPPAPPSAVTACG
jgi:methylthioribose-1-phosphate isomerase